MAVKISSSQDRMIEHMTSLVFGGFSGSALGVLENSELTTKQKEKITTILTQPHGDYTSETAQAMKQSIIAVIRGEYLRPAVSGKQSSFSQTAQIPPSEREDYVTFTDDPRSPFSNAHPCTFEFWGKIYQNATACFLAQQYVDQPEAMDLSTSPDPEEAAAMAETHSFDKRAQALLGKL